MRRDRMLLPILAILIVQAGPALAQQPGPVPRPCAAIRAACQAAGFVPQGAKAGDGLVVDCIRPIMQGAPQPPRAARGLPAIDPQLIEACKAQNPSFSVTNAQRRQPMAAPAQSSAPPPQPPTAAPPEPPASPEK
jgi:hypothetical protein